jgi:hypothetical protein
MGGNAMKRVSALHRDELRQMCALGLTLAEMGAHFNISRERVRQWLLEQQLTTRRQDDRKRPLVRGSLSLTAYHSLRDCGLHFCRVCRRMFERERLVKGSCCRKCENVRCVETRRKSAVIRETSARWKAAHPDRVRQYVRRYQESHREAIRQHRREYYAANRDRILELAKARNQRAKQRHISP